MLEELMGHILIFAVRVVDGILGLFGVLRAGSQTMRENSRVGESPMEANSHHWWDRLYNRWFWLSLLLLLLGFAAALGASREWW